MPGMENRKGIDALDDPALAGAGESKAEAAAATPAMPSSPQSEASLRSGVAGKRPAERPTDEERREMHASFNNRISYLCKLVALVIAIVAFATIALGREVPRYVFMGLCLAVALLAIAMLQEHYQRRR